jgi:hypothetical protein
VNSALNQGKYVGAVLVDLQKAFDTIDHKILLNKCSSYGLRGKIYNILNCYLTDRRACVKINDSISNKLNILQGVPQGSVLGPLLFLLFINDIESCVTFSNIVLFADDIFMMSMNYDHNDLLNNIQYDFDKINEWLINNDVYISDKKTVNMLIKTPHMKQNSLNLIVHTESCNNYNCKTNCETLQEVGDAKYLGISLDSKWKFDEHINNLVKKLRRLLPKLYQLKDILNTKNKLAIYNAWVVSHLRYGIELYGFASQYLIMRLQRIQNKIIKVLFKTKNDQRDTQTLYKQYKILNINNLRDFVVIIKNYFNDDYKIKDVSNKTSLRETSIRFTVPLWRNDYGKRCKKHYIPVIFNKLPVNLQKAYFTSFKKLKLQLVDWLLEN